MSSNECFRVQCVSQHKQNTYFFSSSAATDRAFQLEKSIGILYRAAGNYVYYVRVQNLRWRRDGANS